MIEFHLSHVHIKFYFTSFTNSVNHSGYNCQTATFFVPHLPLFSSHLLISQGFRFCWTEPVKVWTIEIVLSISYRIQDSRKNLLKSSLPVVPWGEVVSVFYTHLCEMCSFEMRLRGQITLLCEVSWFQEYKRIPPMPVNLFCLYFLFSRLLSDNWSFG